MLSELIVFTTPFSDDVANATLNFRVVVWITSELFLLVAVLSNFVARTFPRPSPLSCIKLIIIV